MEVADHRGSREKCGQLAQPAIPITVGMYEVHSVTTDQVTQPEHRPEVAATEGDHLGARRPEGIGQVVPAGVEADYQAAPALRILVPDDPQDDCLATARPQIR